MKTDPDFELRNIFLLLLIVIPLFFKKDDDKLFEFFQENFFKYDKKAQLNILSKKLEFSKIFESSEGSCDILVSQIIFKNEENSQLFSGKIEDYEKALELCKEPKKQALIFIYIALIKNQNQEILSSKNLKKKIDIETLVEFFEYYCEKNEKKIMEKSENYYKGLKDFFENREEQAFKCLSFQLQMKILQDAPKDKKVWFFSLLSDKNRTKETLEKIKEIDVKEAEKYLFFEKNEIKIENKEVKNTNEH